MVYATSRISQRAASTLLLTSHPSDDSGYQTPKTTFVREGSLVLICLRFECAHVLSGPSSRASRLERYLQRSVGFRPLFISYLYAFLLFLLRARSYPSVGLGLLSFYLVGNLSRFSFSGFYSAVFLLFLLLLQLEIPVVRFYCCFGECVNLGPVRSSKEEKPSRRSSTSSRQTVLGALLSFRFYLSLSPSL